MPLYEYECPKGHRYEKQEPFGSPSQHTCQQPRCRAIAKRVLIPPQVHFKGSGWYKTDSRGSGSRLSSTTSSSSDGDSGSSADTSTEADTAPRPAATSD